MAFHKLVALLLVIMVIADVMAAKPKKQKKNKKKQSPVDESEFLALKAQLQALEEKVNSADGGDSTCSANNVHFFFHGDDHDHIHEHGDDDTHVHVDLHLSDTRHGGDAHGHHEHVAMCVMSDRLTKGTVTIYQEDNEKSANFHFQFSKMAHEDADFDFHVHQFGDISNNCKNVGGHYDPYHDNDVCDLGTIRSNKAGAIVDVWKNDTHLTMFGEYTILGRSMMVHDDHDHVSCCMIGVSPETHDHDDDHSHDHSAHDHDHSSHDHTSHGHDHDHDHGHNH